MVSSCTAFVSKLYIWYSNKDSACCAIDLAARRRCVFFSRFFSLRLSFMSCFQSVGGCSLSALISFQLLHVEQVVSGGARGVFLFLSVRTPLNLTFFLLCFRSSTWRGGGAMEGMCVCVVELALNKSLPISNSRAHTPPGPGPSYSSSNFFSFLRASSIISFL